MLKQSLFSPTRPRRAKTRLFPCSVLASLPRTVKRETRVSFGAAALLDELFEHPAQLFSSYSIPFLSAIEMLQ